MRQKGKKGFISDFVIFRQLSSRGIWINKEGADLALVNIYDDDNDNGDIDIYSYPPICMPSPGRNNT